MAHLFACGRCCCTLICNLSFGTHIRTVVKRVSRILCQIGLSRLTTCWHCREQTRLSYTERITHVQVMSCTGWCVLLLHIYFVSRMAGQSNNRYHKHVMITLSSGRLVLHALWPCCKELLQHFAARDSASSHLMCQVAPKQSVTCCKVRCQGTKCGYTLGGLLFCYTTDPSLMIHLHRRDACMQSRMLMSLSALHRTEDHIVKT